MMSDFLTGPYSQLLGVESHEPPVEHDSLLTIEYSDMVLGRVGFIHGGAIAGLLEIAAYTAVARMLRREGREDIAQIKPINVAVEYMRGGREQTTFAAGRVLRLGKRIANVESVAWQGSPDHQIATAQMHFLLKAGKEEKPAGTGE